jgi:succinate dehydrogenase / fumarate reductase cytochrome b subunit
MFTAMGSTSDDSFFVRNEFLIRRLHSLSGLIPVGAYMTVHLIVNASLLNGAGTFQSNVNQIHSLGELLPFVEWAFIFLPIIFHAVVGVWIIRSGKPNQDHYRYAANWRYTLQRWTGVIAIVFIFTHVFHLHGWFHSDWWLESVAKPLGMAQFKPYNAASTLGMAMQGYVWPAFYVVGIVASVFHLANGVWTMGITWGVWISPRAQRNASYICAAGGALLLLVGLSALVATTQVDVPAAKEIEDAMYESKVATGEIVADPHKRTDGEKEAADSEEGSDEAAEEDVQEQESSVAGGSTLEEESGRTSSGTTPTKLTTMKSN